MRKTDKKVEPVSLEAFRKAHGASTQTSRTDKPDQGIGAQHDNDTAQIHRFPFSAIVYVHKHPDMSDADWDYHTDHSIPD